MLVTVPNQSDSSPVFQWRVQSEIADSEHAVEDDIMSVIWKACSFVLDPYRTTIFVLFFFFFFFFNCGGQMRAMISDTKIRNDRKMQKRKPTETIKYKVQQRRARKTTPRKLAMDNITRRVPRCLAGCSSCSLL